MATDILLNCTKLWISVKYFIYNCILTSLSIKKVFSFLFVQVCCYLLSFSIPIVRHPTFSHILSHGYICRHV